MPSLAKCFCALLTTMLSARMAGVTAPGVAGIAVVGLVALAMLVVYGIAGGD